MSLLKENNNNYLWVWNIINNNMIHLWSHNIIVSWVSLFVHIHDHRLLVGTQHKQSILFFLYLMLHHAIPIILLLIVSLIIPILLLVFVDILLSQLFRYNSSGDNNPTLKQVHSLIVMSLWGRPPFLLLPRPRPQLFLMLLLMLLLRAVIGSIVCSNNSTSMPRYIPP